MLFIVAVADARQFLDELEARFPCEAFDFAVHDGLERVVMGVNNVDRVIIQHVDILKKAERRLRDFGDEGIAEHAAIGLQLHDRVDHGDDMIVRAEFAVLDPVHGFLNCLEECFGMGRKVDIMVGDHLFRLGNNLYGQAAAADLLF